MTVPEGWKLVPVEPTQAMVEAAFDALPNSQLEGRIRTHYRAMLDAAPTPTPPVQQDGEALDRIAVLEAENERLREALEYVASLRTGGQIEARCRAALENTDAR